MNDEKSLKELLKSTFSSYQLGDKYDAVSVVDSWEQIVGKVIARKTQKVFISKGIIYLTVDSAPLKNELQYHKMVIIEKVNTFAGRELVKDLKIN